MSSKLMNCRFPKSDATVRLFCFPWAGGGSNFYSNWGSAVCDNVEVIGISLPGRETRISEKPTNSVEQIVEEVTKKMVSDYSDKPFALFGHSMGALLAFETAKVLKEKYQKEPTKMYVSGISGPHIQEKARVSRTVSELNDSEFIEYLRSLGGTPEEVLNNSDMMNMFLPMLRADYSIVDDYLYELPDGKPLLSCPIAAFDGKSDRKHEIEAWQRVTTGKLTLNMRDGGHFYLKEPKNMKYLQDFISNDFFVMCG
ncbi:S-acyl fatty acid synthase thioesterase, medium chain [Patella vulgata]|uniref:S-acyl fatty acid synthase thioesterase, medium chain n=1 Tax=Patella vulgata TaxID=6465 RepID=UPI00217F2A02|nr:S-acyl fatty acid synthase thioesterase, medium chain [Patella vulgata]